MIEYRALYQPANNLIGAGCIQQVPHYIRQIGGKRGLVITDAGLVANGTVKKITDLLEAMPVPYSIYDGVVPNPTIDNVTQAKQILDQDGCDFLVAIGGGSPQDVAKAVGILATNGGEIQDYAGVDKSEHPSLPLFAINTTAGTGSEVTRAYVITDQVNKVKMLMVDCNCLATVAFNDPLLMLEMPPGLTAATGMDALTHAVEAYVARGHFPYSDGLALEAIRLVSNSLETVVIDGANMEARTEMCWAEYMAGLAFSNAGLGLVHAMAHQLGGFYNIPHGVANAILLPHAMRFNLSDVKERYGHIARALGVMTDGMTAVQAAYAAIDFIEGLGRAVKIPALRDTAFDPKDVATLALHTLKDTAMQDNFKEASLVDIQQVFLDAYEQQ